MRPQHAPAAPALPSPVRSAGSVLPPARSCRSGSKRASAGPAGSPGSRQERITASPRRFRPKLSTGHRNRDRLVPSAESFALGAASELAAVAARAFRPPRPALSPLAMEKQSWSVTPATIQILVPAANPIIPARPPAPRAEPPDRPARSVVTSPWEVLPESCRRGCGASFPLPTALPARRCEPPTTREVLPGCWLSAALVDTGGARRKLDWRLHRAPAPRGPPRRPLPESLRQSGASVQDCGAAS